jgi:hypothetical protein
VGTRAQHNGQYLGAVQSGQARRSGSVEQMQAMFRACIRMRDGCRMLRRSAWEKSQRFPIMRSTGCMSLSLQALEKKESPGNEKDFHLASGEFVGDLTGFSVAVG